MLGLLAATVFCLTFGLLWLSDRTRALEGRIEVLECAVAELEHRLDENGLYS